MSFAFGVFVTRFLVPTVWGLAATWTDLRERRIPNALSVSLFVCGLVFRTVTDGSSGLVDGLLGFAVGFAILLVLYLIGGGGGGDVKFMAAVGTWIGPYHLLFVFVISAILMLLFVATLVLWQALFVRRVESFTDGEANSEQKLSLFKHKIPYALPATVAILIRLIWLLLINRQS
jgi:prepilin peptidase CpaA